MIDCSGSVEVEEWGGFPEPRSAVHTLLLDPVRLVKTALILLSLSAPRNQLEKVNRKGELWNTLVLADYRLETLWNLSTGCDQKSSRGSGGGSRRELTSCRSYWVHVPDNAWGDVVFMHQIQRVAHEMFV